MARPQEMLLTTPTLVPSVESLTVIESFVRQTAVACVRVAGREFTGRLHAVDLASVTVLADDAGGLGRLAQCDPIALVTFRTPSRRGCFLTFVRQVSDGGRIVLDLPSQVSTIEQRRVRRQAVPPTTLIEARLEHDGGTCAAKIRDLSAKGIGVVFTGECPPPEIGARVNLLLGESVPEVVLPCLVAFVDEERAGLRIAPDVRPEAVLELAAYVGRSV